MKRFLFVVILSTICLGLKAQSSSNRYGAGEEYRRSSLCIIMLTHKGTKYAEEMESQFRQMQLPTRYNEHNCHVKVISVSKSAKKSYVEYLMRDRQVAKELVGKWFNRNPSTGMMNMDLIHQRGGYNADYADLQRVLSTERGVATLLDEGAELIQNTFVLVCDMDYYDKEKTGKGGAVFLSLLSAGLDAYATAQEEEGNTNAASYAQAGSTLAAAGAVISASIGGFAVKMNAHLLRLSWNDDYRDTFYNEYWVDGATPTSEASVRKARFDNEKRFFKLEYIGGYNTRTGKTVFKDQVDLNRVIREVTTNTVNKSMTRLATMYPIFKPRTEFECRGSEISAYIGTKEDVKYSSKYEVVEAKKDKQGEIYYKKVAVTQPFGKIWDNRDISLSDAINNDLIKGTTFRRISGKTDICNSGYTLRERGIGSAQSRKFKNYIHAGVNLSTIPSAGKEAWSYDACSRSVGYHFDYGFNVLMGNSPIYWGMELGLGTRGFRGKSENWDDVYKFHNFNISPTTFGVDYNVSNSVAIDIHLGLYMAYDYAGKVSGEYIGGRSGSDYEYKISELVDWLDYNRFDVGIKYGFGVWLYNKVNIDFLFQNGFSEMYRLENIHSGERIITDNKTRNFIIRVGYAF